MYAYDLGYSNILGRRYIYIFFFIQAIDLLVLVHTISYSTSMVHGTCATLNIIYTTTEHMTARINLGTGEES
jgi:hypothetical protein